MSVASELAKTVLMCKDGVYEADGSIILILSVASTEMQNRDDRIEKLENALKIIASSGEGQFRWSMTKIETMAIEVLSND